MHLIEVHLDVEELHIQETDFQGNNDDSCDVAYGTIAIFYGPRYWKELSRNNRSYAW